MTVAVVIKVAVAVKAMVEVCSGRVRPWRVLPSSSPVQAEGQ